MSIISVVVLIFNISGHLLVVVLISSLYYKIIQEQREERNQLNS